MQSQLLALRWPLWSPLQGFQTYTPFVVIWILGSSNSMTLTESERIEAWAVFSRYLYRQFLLLRPGITTPPCLYPPYFHRVRPNTASSYASEQDYPSVQDLEGEEGEVGDEEERCTR